MIATKVVKAGLCIGCGLCESISGRESVEMQVTPQGFHLPASKNNNSLNTIISKVCPSILVDNQQNSDNVDGIWGKILGLYSGHSTDNEIRTKGSSGGIISAIAIHILENKMVDFVLQVGGDPSNHYNNKLKVSRSREDVLACAASRYAPASVFNDILNILESTSGTFCFIGKPCDVSALKNLVNLYPQYDSRLKLTIAIFCAGMPSFSATNDVINSFEGAEMPVTDLSYRGMGWPGYFSFKDATAKTYKMSYNDSWGKVLGKQIHFRCKICPDGIGLQADIAVGDAWETKSGYPDFQEREGESLVLLRSEKAVEIFNLIAASNEVVRKELQTGVIEKMQPFQYYRRKHVGARIIAVKIARFWNIRFINLNLWRNMISASPTVIVRECLGTLKRLL
ncbi:Coenzyme F420 hydrogenase/dehydrogenase, beta subunit C-terminal domain [Dyadobacter alkalitolerans]|uniref:Coenzyme F420 hydrogenase/dehydrogenase, beta subunit C-terminal domain n=1 Tax=Dyadobacter alkalitolerans TaxID=492736 RepID=UPI000407CD29|nr:Coenzyme F420 hydrogenase/dehydrogenase, beta subunit C-terminal domain [Dyadobacter alkalitolerans]